MGIIERYQKKYQIKLGFVPTRRETFSDTAFRLDKAAETKKMTEAQLTDMGVDFVNIDFLNKEGLLYRSRDAEAVAEYFRQEKVDALFIAHMNFGCEEAVCRLASMIKKPVLLWAVRDDAPEPEGYRFRDAQCGVFASSKVLMRFGVPFTYIENCRVEEDTFTQGVRDFLAAAGVAKAMHAPRIGQISVRPAAFWSVKSNEAELLERFGVEVVPITLVEMQKRFQGILEKKDGCFQEELANLLGKAKQEIVGRDAVERICAMKLAVREWAEEENLSAAATQCWAPFTDISGIAPCYLMGDSTDEGFPIACENDIHGALTSIMALGANKASEPPFFADLTGRHPTNDNAELLWHCGVFPPSLGGDKGVTIGCHQGKGFKGAGQFEMRGGDITLLRFDALRGEYRLLFGEGRTTEGPYSKGTYVWAEFHDWPAWERKFVCGPYIHHCTGIYGKYAHVFMEAVKYLDGVDPDPVYPEREQLERRLR